NHKRKSVYQIEAAIAMSHCISRSVETTNWKHIAELYEGLYKFKPSKLVQLNWIIGLIMSDQLDLAKAKFEHLKESDFKKHKAHFFLVGSELYKALSNDLESKLWVQKALDNIQDEHMHTLLKKRTFETNN
ncbi:MAG: hypothetical protein AAGK97_18955, partial [Bacteroidota bacterium]